MKNRLNDPIVGEIHAIRAKLAARFANDIDAIITHVQARQKASGRSYVQSAEQCSETEEPAKNRAEESHRRAARRIPDRPGASHSDGSRISTPSVSPIDWGCSP